MINRISAKLNLALSIAAGLAGGILSHYVSPELVHAQTPAPAPKVIQAQSFVLVNDAGTKLGEFTIDPDGKPNIRLFDNQVTNSSSRGFYVTSPNGRTGVSPESLRVIWNARGGMMTPLAASR
jgi:hypothetical protein